MEIHPTGAVAPKSAPASRGLTSDAYQQVEQYLTLLFDKADLLELRAVDRSKSKPRVVHRNFLTPAEILARLDRIIAVNQEGNEIFVSVAPRHSHDGTEDGVKTVRSVWVDMDHVDHKEALTQLARVAPAPTAVIASSNSGLHWYWKLDEPFAVDTLERRERFKSMLKRFYAEIGADSVQDVSRVLRLPGTLNWRAYHDRGRAPEECRLLSISNTTHPLSTFARWFQPVEKEREPGEAKPETPATSEALRKAKQIAQSLTRKTNDRSKLDYAVLCNMLRAGVTDPQEVWDLVQSDSKFQERGRPYFDLTFSKTKRAVGAEASWEEPAQFGTSPPAAAESELEDLELPAAPTPEVRAMSTRATVLVRRTYSRKKEDGTYESFPEIIDRVIKHQAWLWARALRHPTPEALFTGAGLSDVLPKGAVAELEELRSLMLTRAALVSGRTLWLGGTKTARTRESSQFNCSYVEIQSVHDAVDAFWLLLQGCGVGLRPVAGCLYGFTTYVPKLTMIPSIRSAADGSSDNTEHYDAATKTWTIIIGDSAEGWAKSLGKLLAGKHYGCRELRLDFSEIRPAGSVIRGYGWACQGYRPLAEAYRKVFEIMNRHAGQMLSFGALHDIMNLTGTVLSSRRSAQIALCDYGDDHWEEFAEFKRDYFSKEVNRPWREQSNNTLEFHAMPSRQELEDLFQRIVASGGSEPGIRNARAATRRAPWAKGTNPCGEILLPGRGGFCNLAETNVSHPHHHDFDNLMRTLWIISRANYRQTCVDLQDGVLQRSFHENNENLRLCGVGLTGIVERDDLTPDRLETMRGQARAGANSMADELEMPRPAAVTTIKPSGTLSKVLDCTEGIHRPLGKWILNNIEFSRYSPLPDKLALAGYDVTQHPTKPDAVLVAFPVAYENVAFDELADGREGNLEPAVSQLERYRKFLSHWADHNVSCTISYDVSEVPDIIDWLMDHWDEQVGVSFLFRADPSARAAELGYPYLPQEVITKEEYDAYVAKLSRVELDSADTDDLALEDCQTGACPVR